MARKKKKDIPTVTRKDIADVVASKTGYSAEVISTIMGMVEGEILDGLMSGAEVRLQGFGVFGVKKHSRIEEHYNVSTGEKGPIPERHKAFFRKGTDVIGIEQTLDAREKEQQ